MLPVAHAIIAQMAESSALGRLEKACMQQMHSVQGEVYHQWGLRNSVSSMWNRTSVQEGAHRITADNQGGAGGGGDR